VLYGPAAHKGKKGERVCVLSYCQADPAQARGLKPRIISLIKKNRLKE
jgi:aspartate 1-decarboxylase